MFQIQSRALVLDSDSGKRSYSWFRVYGTPTSTRARDLEERAQRLADRNPQLTFRIAKAGATRATIVLVATARVAGPNSWPVDVVECEA
jgi:hypothetical protein